MPNRYCIASGTFTDTAIWSATDGGPGGASVPTTTDDIFLNGSVDVAGWIGSNSDNRNIIVGLNVDASIEFAAANKFAIRSGKKLTIEGKLSLIPNGETVNIYSGGTAIITEAGRLDCGLTSLSFMQVSSVSADAGILDNKGTITNSGNLHLYASSVQEMPHRIGNVSNCTVYPPSNLIGVTEATCRFRGNIDASGYLRVNTRSGQSHPMVIDFADTIIRTRGLIFTWNQTNLDFFVRWLQNGLLEVSGNVEQPGPSAAPTVDWQLGPNASLAFVGSNDQEISMPPSVLGQTWTVDKPAGNLDLTVFDGFLQGRLRRLTVRPASSVDLAGPPTLLPTTMGTWHCYYGLKADAVSPEGPTTVEEHLREAMDSCDNYGLITIPDGKTLCTKEFRNHTGARISGTGTLCVRYGGLTNTGTIDPTVNVRYFDLPVFAALSAPDSVFANTLFAVDLAGSVGTWLRLDWDDESFSETQSPGLLTHGYVESDGIALRTLRLTVGTAEGKTDAVTKTITVFPSSGPDGPVASGPVERYPKKSLHGIPRGNLPTCYRFTLALGKRFMYDTLQLFCPMSESGRALESGSGLYLGRISHSNGRLPDPSEIASASYTVYRLDASDASVRTPIKGHTEVVLDVTEILLEETVVDENWPFDDIGYNFRHTPNDTAHPPFPVAGRYYLVVYTLRPVAQPPKIIFQYRVHVI